MICYAMFAWSLGGLLFSEEGNWGGVDLGKRRREGLGAEEGGETGCDIIHERIIDFLKCFNSLKKQKTVISN